MDHQKTPILPSVMRIDQILAPVRIHDADDIAQRLFLKHGADAALLHPLQILRDAFDLCREGLGGEDSMGLTWRITSPVGLPFVQIDFQYETGDESTMRSNLPFTRERIEHDFSTHNSGESAGVILDYVIEQQDESDRNDIWRFLVEDCQEYERCLDSAQRILDYEQLPVFLRDAAAQGHLKAIEDGLVLGADPRAADKAGNTPLHLAAAAGHTALVKPLVIGGNPVNQANALGQSPLHLAARNGHASACLALMAENADTTLADKRGRTPLALARGQLIVHEPHL